MIGLQVRLNRDRPGAVLVDGNYGAATEEGVRKLQQTRRLPMAGIADTDTLAHGRRSAWRVTRAQPDRKPVSRERADPASRN